jgi:hypothetical protein
MSMAKVMVELHAGYGDGFGVILVDDAGRVQINPARKVKRYADGSPMETWKQTILSAPSVDLVDGGVRVSPGAIKRIIGPLDCPEASRVRARRYTKNFRDNGFVSLASDEEIVAAMSHTSEPATHAAICTLQAKYQPQPV